MQCHISVTRTQNDGICQNGWYSFWSHESPYPSSSSCTQALSVASMLGLHQHQHKQQRQQQTAARANTAGGLTVAAVKNTGNASITLSTNVGTGRLSRSPDTMDTGSQALSCGRLMFPMETPRKRRCGQHCLSEHVAAHNSSNMAWRRKQRGPTLRHQVSCGHRIAREQLALTRRTEEGY